MKDRLCVADEICHDAQFHVENRGDVDETIETKTV